MSNPESVNNHPSNDEANKWNILPQDNFYQFQQNSQEAPKNQPNDEEIKQAILAKKRSEALRNNHETHQKARRATAALLGLAITATVIVGNAITKPRDDFLKSEQAKQKVIEMEDVEEIVFYGNLRSNPEITNREDSNTHASIDEEVILSVPNDSKIMYYHDENDPNGAWYGIPTDLLEDEAFISKKEARSLEKDRDQYTWVNENNAHINRK